MSMRSEIVLGDCRKVLAAMESSSVDSLVTDPPAGISFMGKKWDSYEGVSGFHDFLFGVMGQCLRVMKPGAYGLVWSLPRTSHHTGMALERAGFEIRDCVYHLFGTGFPKSLDVSKAIDKQAGAERPITETYVARGFSQDSPTQDGRNMWNAGEVVDKQAHRTSPATDAARQWEGYGTALKPAAECWWLVRKPLEKKTVAEQVLATGTGALNIDASRVKPSGERLGGGGEKRQTFEKKEGWSRPWMSDLSRAKQHAEKVTANVERASKLGRWPANVVLSHAKGCISRGTKKVKAITGTLSGSWRRGGQYGGGYAGAAEGELGEPVGYGDEDGTETVEDYDCAESCPVAALDLQSGKRSAGHYPSKRGKGGVSTAGHAGQDSLKEKMLLAGGASRFFSNFEPDSDAQPFIYATKASAADRMTGLESGENTHPTVKGQGLMQYLVRLVTPAGGLVLDPFAGSGSTLVAAIAQGFSCVGIEKEAEYGEIAKARMACAIAERDSLTKQVSVRAALKHPAQCAIYDGAKCDCGERGE